MEKTQTLQTTDILVSETAVMGKLHHQIHEFCLNYFVWGNIDPQLTSCTRWVQAIKGFILGRWVTRQWNMKKAIARLRFWPRNSRHILAMAGQMVRNIWETLQLESAITQDQALRGSVFKTNYPFIKDAQHGVWKGFELLSDFSPY